jgi:Cu(I)/Ag(I) efflux system membrane fusion protein/cobalt-zinc-cadmium efflux system membrane fusion protein
MSQQIYKYAFVVTLLVSLALAAALGYLLQARSEHPDAEEDAFVAAKGPQAPGTSSSPATSPAMNSEAPQLTPVQLSPQRLQAIGVTTAVARLQTVSNQLQVPGNVDMDERRLAYVQTRFPGWIQKVLVNASYQYVRQGQPMFTIYSPELVSTEQEYILAKQSQQTFANDMHGTGAGESAWLLQAAADRLRQFGVPADEIARLEKTGTVQHDITIESPASGYITEFNALPNTYAQPEMKLYTIADLSSVWVNANVYQTDVGQLTPGTPATVTVDAYPGRQFHGRIDQVLPQVDPMTRTAHVRFVFANAGLLLKPGMFVNVNIDVPLGRQLMVPASGVLYTGTRDVAFLDHGDGYLEPREVETGPRLNDQVVILKGLRAGDRIVSSANFLVDSEAQLQAAMGAFAPPPPGAGAAASMNGPAGQGAIEFSTEPSPPWKGNNVLRVKLTNDQGKPVTQAQVRVTFYMAAMPAMGMAAINKSAILGERGNGAYEGSLELANGGSYQVTIAAAKDGKTIAGKQLNLNATGGMQ